MSKVRWGIMGLGRIAGIFAEGLRSEPGSELVACGSRSVEKAQEFGEKYGAPRRHGSYLELARDPEVEAVYVATPHPQHMECAIMCMEAGKAVLCEKPFAVNAREAAEMVRVARERGVLLVEAMWTRFLPHMAAVQEVILSGRIGEPRMLQADFGFRAGVDPEGRLFSPNLAGGALMDVGVYTVSLATLFFGEPKGIRAVADIGSTLVDEQTAVALSHEDGRLSLLSSAIRTNTPQEFAVFGTDGSVRVSSPWWRPTSFTVRTPKGEEKIEPPHVGNGYNYEAAEFARCLREGLTECPVMPLDETLSVMRTLDEIRRQCGVKYPMDRE